VRVCFRAFRIVVTQDLKKQTAIRLAQEQKQGQNGGEGGGVTYEPSGPRGAGGYSGAGAALQAMSTAPPIPGHGDRMDGYSVNRTVQGGHGYGGRPQHGLAPEQIGAQLSHNVPPPPRVDRYRPPPSPQQYGGSAMYSSTSQPSSQRSRPPTSHLSSSFESSAKPKLPHGLTVSELKEMTKARLQAEASSESQEKGLSNSSISPALPMFEHRDKAPDSRSPLPPTIGAQRPRTHSASRDAWSQDGGSRSEAWETGSVSTAASDYLGSESAYGVGSYAGDDPSPSPYGLNGSFHSHGGPVSNFSDAPPPDSLLLPGVARSSPSPSMYADGIGQNRRRAATLSPRQGLSYLDERHEVQGELPVFPSFISPMNRLYPSRSSYSSRGNAPSTIEPTRARTSSAASLPPISHTAEEFEHPAAASFRRYPSGHIASLREDAPSPTVTGLADVFRESPPGFRNVAVPPPGLCGTSVPSGLGLRSGLGSVDSFSGGSGGDPRGRASTWAGSSADGVFGPGLIGTSVQPQDAICDDLATILNLSVAEENRNGMSSSLYPPPGL